MQKFPIKIWKMQSQPLYLQKINIFMAKEKQKNNTEPPKEKKVNRTWEAFGKWKGAFTIIDPKFLL
jgi:hypothetical protein